MEQKPSVLRMLLSVLVGVALGVFLTRALWGTEPYQVAISVVAGVLLGLFIADYRFVKSISVDMSGFVSLADRAQKKLKLPEIISWIKKAQSFQLSFILKTAVAIAYLICVVLSFEEKTSGYYIIMYVLAPLIFYFVCIFFPYIEIAENGSLNGRGRKVWGVDDSVCYIVEYLKENNYSLFYIEKKLFIHGLWYLCYAVLIIAKFIFSAVLSILAVALGVVLVPVWIINLFFVNGSALLIASSILVGILTGTYYSPFWYGFIAGPVFLFAGIVLRALKVGIFDPWWTCREGGNLDYLWSKWTFEIKVK